MERSFSFLRHHFFFTRFLRSRSTHSRKHTTQPTESRIEIKTSIPAITRSRKTVEYVCSSPRPTPTSTIASRLRETSSRISTKRRGVIKTPTSSYTPSFLREYDSDEETKNLPPLSSSNLEETTGEIVSTSLPNDLEQFVLEEEESEVMANAQGSKTSDKDRHRKNREKHLARLLLQDPTNASPVNMESNPNINPQAVTAAGSGIAPDGSSEESFDKFSLDEETIEESSNAKNQLSSSKAECEELSLKDTSVPSTALTPFRKPTPTPLTIPEMKGKFSQNAHELKLLTNGYRDLTFKMKLLYHKLHTANMISLRILNSEKGRLYKYDRKIRMIKEKLDRIRRMRKYAENVEAKTKIV